MSITTIDISPMQKAVDVAQASIDPSIQNGAVIVSAVSGSVIASACNEFPWGVDHGVAERWERPAKYQWIEHAERNAIFRAAMHGQPTLGATMFCPWASCADCARAIVQAGIVRLVRFPGTENDRWNDSIQVGDTILEEGGVEVIEISMNDFDIPADLRLGQFRP